MRRRLGRTIRRNRTTLAIALAAVLASSGTAAAASYLVLSATNTASKTTTLRTGANAAVLSLKNTNASGATSAKGLTITVPSGRAPIAVNSGAGKATNLNADKLDGLNSTAFLQGRALGYNVDRTDTEAITTLTDLGGIELAASCPAFYFGTGTVVNLYATTANGMTVDYAYLRAHNQTDPAAEAGQSIVTGGKVLGSGRQLVLFIEQTSSGLFDHAAGTLMIRAGSALVEVDFSATANNGWAGYHACSLYGTAILGS